MAVSKAQQKAVGKYVKANYDLYQVKMPKGQKEVVQAHAAERDESVNGFINRAIGETMERDEEMEREELLLRKEAAEHGFSVNAMQNITEFAEAVDTIERHIPGSRDKILAGEVGKPLDWEFPRFPVE